MGQRNKDRCCARERAGSNYAIIFIAMIASLKNILHHICLLDITKPIIAGVSGGPDSLCLLDLLVQAGFLVHAAHFNHLLRPEAGDDAHLVGKVAEGLGIPFVYAEDDVGAYARSQRVSIEEAARLLRYRFLFGEAEARGAQAVAVAHHADDQVETVLMHLLRGAGPAGLVGMRYRSLPSPWSQNIPLVRPILAVWREEILDYVADRGLTPAQDATNLDTTYFRNRLRHELLPYLATYNPQIRQVFWRMSEVMREDYETIEMVVQSAWRECAFVEEAGAVAFTLGRFCGYAAGVQRGLLRRAVGILRPGLRDIGLEAVERARRLANSPSNTHQVDLAAGLFAFCEAGRLWVASREAGPSYGPWPRLSGSVVLELPVSGTLELAEGWVMQAELMDISEEIYRQAEYNRDLTQAWLDTSRLRLPLHLRLRRSGDRFCPLGLDGHSTRLTDFMVNVKMPRRARDGWPLVCSGEEIVWIPYYRQSHSSRLTVSTRQVVHLQIKGGVLML
jgi:tRNA(Ile)-lysidine synthase